MVTVDELLTYGNYLTFFFILLPVLINSKYFSQFKLPEYGLISIYFLSVFLDTITVALFVGGTYPQLATIVQSGLFVLTGNILIFCIVVRISYERFPNWAKIGVLIYSLLAIILVIMRFQSDTQLLFRSFNTHQSLRSPTEVIIFLFIAYKMYELHTVENSSRVKYSKFLWVSSSLCRAGTHIFVTSWILLDKGGFALLPQWELRIALALTLIWAILHSVNHFWFPEAVLLSHVQIHRAIEMYGMIEKANTDNSILSLGQDQIVSYLKAAQQLIQDI